MYSEKILRMLRKIDADVYDRVSIETSETKEAPSRKLEGLLMPHPDTGDADCLVLKLKSGYNVGIFVDDKSKINLIEKYEAKNKPAKKPEKSKEKKEKTEGNVISILGCGGTISSKVEYLTGAVYPAMTEEELLSMFPELKEVNVRSETVFSVLSEDMTPAHWSQIAEKAKEHIDGGATGIVITHGTDTMHYTSAALSFMLQNLPVPVILTGAQRSSDRGSTDARLNLLSSVLGASSDFGEVGLCMHANINDNFAYVHRGTRVRKMHTSRRDAFKSINELPLLRIDPWAKKVDELNPFRKKSGSAKALKFDNKASNNVAMIYVHPGIKPELIDSLSSYEGVVVVGTGLGHVSTNPFGDKLSRPIVNSIKSLVDSDIPVAISSQTIYGRVNINVYTAGRMLKDAGVIGHLCDWTPETAYAKLCWVLGHEKKMNKLKEEMERNIAGEISDRSIVL